MEMRRLGRTDMMVSSCCLGTMTWGEQNSEAEAHAQMDMALERGVNFFDTAELYPVPIKGETQGRTEAYIGTWFKASGRRADVILATKVVGPTDRAWFRDDGRPTRVEPTQIDEAVAKSLTRLQSDYIDLYQIHWPDRGVSGFGHFAYKDYDPTAANSVEVQLEALARHVEAGRIRAIGVSNETPWGVMQFVRAAEDRGWPRIASIQNAYHLANRVFEYGLAETAMREDVGLLAYSPLAMGYLTGKYRDGALPAGSRKQRFGGFLQRYERAPDSIACIDSYLDLAAEHGMDPTHLALKFCETRAFCTSVIIGATSLEQLATDLDAFAVTWTPELESAVNTLHARTRSPAP